MATNEPKTPGNAMLESRAPFSGVDRGRSAFLSVTATEAGVVVDWTAFSGASETTVDLTGIYLRRLVINNLKNQSTIFAEIDESGVGVPVGAFVERVFDGYNTGVPLKIIEGATGGEVVIIEAYYDPATVSA